ncbi:MAG: hypothetical protein IE883_02055 [Epsilonproteobacteria bacterium]|nr:hypothetical protein [Campylobacterota bacterium]
MGSAWLIRSLIDPQAHFIFNHVSMKNVMTLSLMTWSVLYLPMWVIYVPSKC